MALKKLAKKEESKPLQLTIVPTKEVQSERIYANYLAVNHGPYDFTLTFCDVQTPLALTEEDKLKLSSQKTIQAAVQVEIAIPAGLMEQIIYALESNYDQYKKRQNKKADEEKNK